jgi:hypothetical protein
MGNLAAAAPSLGSGVLAALAAQASHPVVAGLLGLGTAGVAGGVVAMAWSIHVHQIRLAGQLARRQLIVTDGTAASPDGARDLTGAAAASGTGLVNGTGTLNGTDPPGGASSLSVGALSAGDGLSAGGTLNGAGGASGGGSSASGAGRPAGAGTPPAAARSGPAAPVVIEGPDTVIAGDQARYRVTAAGSRKVESWAVGGGAVSQAPDPVHPDELLLVADEPGTLSVTVRVREGMTQYRGIKSVTAVPDLTPAGPPVSLRLFLHGWGLVAVAVLIIGFAGALAALGTLAGSDFIALVTPLAALIAVVAGAPGSRRPGMEHARMAVTGHPGRDHLSRRPLRRLAQ